MSENNLHESSNEQNHLENNNTPYTKIEDPNDQHNNRVIEEEQGILLENQQPQAVIQSKEEIHEEIEMTDRQLDTCWYSAYKTWVGVFMVISLIGTILGMIETFIVKFAYVYLVGVFGCAWNTKHLYEEYQALAYKDIIKATKAMQSFRAFIVVMPLLFLCASMIEGLEVITVIFGIVGIVVVFFFLVVLGAQMALCKLQHREELEKKLNILMKS